MHTRCKITCATHLVYSVTGFSLGVLGIPQGVLYYHLVYDLVISFSVIMEQYKHKQNAQTQLLLHGFSLSNSTLEIFINNPSKFAHSTG